MKFHLTVIFAFVFTANEIFCQNPTILAFKELKAKTFPDVYDKDIRPNLGEDNLEIGVSLYILSYKMNLIKKELYIEMYFRQKWIDPRLRRSNTDINIIGSQSLSDRIWIPDTFFSTASVVNHNKYPTPNVFVRITPEGEILYSQGFQSTIGCKSDKPFCKLVIESYGHSVNDIDYKPMSGTPVAISAAIPPVPGFPIVDLKMIKKMESLSSGNYSLLEVNIEFKKPNNIDNEIIESTTNQTK